MGILQRISSEQEVANKAFITKEAGKETMAEFLEISKTMRSLDPYIGDLKFLILLEEISNNMD